MKLHVKAFCDHKPSGDLCGSPVCGNFSATEEEEGAGDHIRAGGEEQKVRRAMMKPSELGLLNSEGVWAEYGQAAPGCVTRSHNPSDYRILLGYNQLSNPTNYSLKMTVNKFIVHADYDKIHHMSRDIVLMQLHRPMEFTSHVHPICLPNSSFTLPIFTSCWISGWGMITEDRFLPALFQLQEGELILISNEQCAAEYMHPSGVQDPSEFQVKEDMLCAAEYRMGRSICRGDSGGPLVCPVQGVWYLMGVASWSAECVAPVGPNIFSRITYFINWIQEKKQANPDPDISLAPPQEKLLALTGLNSQGTVEPQIFIVLLSSQIFLLQLILLRNL
ncbi:Testicular serine protease 2 [Heterocephalus glaber]|uniref:Testicular serine protease 2 n=1 Tax=Heterocephalus glaber TaxID=10181 RepID=G5B9W9_HETGA|nr:Testicular serine protease 2 [Heterocephalus glaber]